MRIVALIGALALSASIAATAGVTHRRQHGLAPVAPHCVKSVACGNACIAKGKICPASVKKGHPKGSS